MHCGRAPTKVTLFPVKYCKFCRLQMAGGMVVTMLLLLSARAFKNGRHCISSGSWPVTLNPVRFNSMTFPFWLQVTPCHAQTGALVAQRFAPTQKLPPSALKMARRASRSFVHY